MSDFVIIPDSSSDLTADLRKRYDIPDYLRGVMYYPDGHSELADLDWGNITPEEFYNSMKDKKPLYKTASVPRGEVERVFEKYLKEGKDILSISLSSGLSGSYQSCCLGAKDLMEKYPERKIICIDSLRYSTALALLVAMASEKRSQGATIEEVAEWCEQNKHSIHQMGPMDDLFFLCKTGRISNFKAFFGTLVGVNPMADFNRKGLAEVLVKCKGKKMAFDVTLNYVERTAIDIKNQTVFIAHSNRPEAAQKLKELIAERFSPKGIIINSVGMSCGASIGPGLCAVFYLGKPISEDNVEEKEIIAEITAKQ